MDPAQRRYLARRRRSATRSVAVETGDEDMLGMAAAVLIVLWLFGFFAFHVTNALIRTVLVTGIVLLILHFFTGRGAIV